MDWGEESIAVMYWKPFTSASAAGATRGNPESSCHPERSEGPRSARFLGGARFFVACWLLRMTVMGRGGTVSCLPSHHTSESGGGQHNDKPEECSFD